MKKTIHSPRRLPAALGLLLGIVFLAGCQTTDATVETVTCPAETTVSVETTAATEPTQTTAPPPEFTPEKTASGDPANWGVTWEVIQGEAVLTEYLREEEITFGDPEEYFALPGIATFRGNNYRNGATYGTAEVVDEEFSRSWQVDTGELGSASGVPWAGSGWTGQPLIVKWDEETKQIMNLREEKKQKEDLVEVIYATLDGRIYFLDLEDGSYTRDPLYIGMSFKGAGSLDPRGYPLMYVGSGDVNAYGQRPRMYVISLIDTSVLYEYGSEETMQLRTDHDSWCAFDSAPLVHGDTDTLIWPGENGILYTIRLNTRYDKAAGTISVSPETPVGFRYDTERSGSDDYWYGFEASASIVDNYLYVSENGGMFYCIDLNTMDLVWAQDTRDDSNSSPVFERVSEEQGYIYTAPSLHWTAGSRSWGEISVYKLDAITGEIIWETPFEVSTIDGVSGGVQATGLLGKAGTSIEGMIIYPIARYGAMYSGAVVALDTDTGEVLWQVDTQLYSWSSPVAIYTDDGRAYVVVGDAEGIMRLIDGATGEVLDTISIYSIVEASPAVYENTLVVGTRGYMIHCLTID